MGMCAFVVGGQAFFEGLGRLFSMDSGPEVSDVRDHSPLSESLFLFGCELDVMRTLARFFGESAIAVLCALRPDFSSVLSLFARGRSKSYR